MSIANKIFRKQQKKKKQPEKPLLPTFNILSRELHVCLVCGPQIINVMFLISENEILRTICSLFRGRQNNNIL